MVAQVLALGSAAVQATPAVLDQLKKRFPTQYSKMSELWRRSTSGAQSLPAAAQAVVRNNDSSLAGAIYRTALRANLSADDIMSVADNRAAEALRSHLGAIQQYVLADVQSNELAVVSTGTTPDALSAKKGELRRVQKFTGFTLRQLRELVVFVNTTSVAQLDEIERSVAESQGIMVS